MPLLFVGSIKLTYFQRRVPIKLNNFTDKNQFKPMIKTMVQVCIIWTLNDKLGFYNIFRIIWVVNKSKYTDGERLLSTYTSCHENSWFCRLLLKVLVNFVRLIWFFTSHQQYFSYVGTGLPNWTSTKLEIMCLAKWHNAATLVRLESTAPGSGVKHSTTLPLCSSAFSQMISLSTHVLKTSKNVLNCHLGSSYLK